MFDEFLFPLHVGVRNKYWLRLRFLFVYSLVFPTFIFISFQIAFFIFKFNHDDCFKRQLIGFLIKIYYGKPPKKKVKKFHNKCEIRGGGQQILVCEPQKSAFFRANFPKKHAEINS